MNRCKGMSVDSSIRIANEFHKEISPDSWLELLDNQTVCLKPKCLEDHSNPIGIVYHGGCGPSPGIERTFGSKGGIEALVRGYLLVRLSQEILLVHASELFLSLLDSDAALNHEAIRDYQGGFSCCTALKEAWQVAKHGGGISFPGEHLKGHGLELKMHSRDGINERRHCCCVPLGFIFRMAQVVERLACNPVTLTLSPLHSTFEAFHHLFRFNLYIPALTFLILHASPYTSRYYIQAPTLSNIPN
ncbi:hypothetical protein VNO77_22914 [Canavalia gladiata]|uniref:Uncharacterized protein n=1 Tax=Canavalia gladiata TaxID=3824 RepID=A0AAN9L622_CANGL